MDLSEENASFNEGDGTSSTVDPAYISEISVSIIPEEVSTLTVATIVGVSLVVLITIATVFLLGVLLDCRQQRLLEKKMGEVKKLKNQRRVNTHPDSDVAGITNNMEEMGTSIAPAEMLRSIP